MDSVQQLKLTQFNTNQKATAKQVASNISQLNNHMSAAIEHQAYARKNPDTVVDATLLNLMGAGVDELLAQFAEVAAKRDDLLAVKNGSMTVDALITKHNVDLTSYSNSLI